MHQYRAPFRELDTFFAVRSWVDCITNMSGFDLRQAQDISRLRFRYAIEGDNPPWRPVSAFDDGSKVYIEMPSGIAQGEAPPLFVVGPEGDGQLVNYRVRQNYYIVDR